MFGALLHPEKLEEIQGGGLDVQAHLVQGTTHLCGDGRRAIGLSDAAVGAEEVEDGMVRHGMSIGEAAPFEICHPFADQELAKLVEQARLAAPRFCHYADDLP